jgi:hypothetical protein
MLAVKSSEYWETGFKPLIYLRSNHPSSRERIEKDPAEFVTARAE